MKKILSAVMALAMCLSLSACGGGNQANVAELEQTISDMKEKKAEMAAVIEEREATIEELREELNQYEEYSWLISSLEDGEYDYIIDRMEDMKEEAKKAELEAKGVQEITITIDNWDQYFEYVPSGYPYIYNSFNELTHMNMVGGLTLKDEYQMAEGSGTKVSFEMETNLETRSCTVDFTTGTFEYGEVTKQEPARTNAVATTSYSDYTSGNLASFGSLAQMNNSDGNLSTQNVQIGGLVQMLRAEGTLYIYGK